ncbi:GlxA family transcriptional regulator [Marinobacteraceae bacterium S3BR75-40.1]
MITDVGLVLLPGCSALVYASASEPLLVCNRLVGEERYRLRHFHVGGPVHFGSQLAVATEALPEAPEALPQWLLICGGTASQYRNEPALQRWLQSQGRHCRAVGGLASGGLALADAGMLDGYRAALHGGDHRVLQERFPRVRLSSDVLVADRDRFTCRGGTAALDLVGVMIGREQGADVAEALSEAFVRERVGETSEPERLHLDDTLRREQPALAASVDLMASNIEEPLGAEELASHAGVSRRQLERLFRRHLNTVPSRYYLQLRLEKARDRVREGTDSITDIALGCGFSSGAHFSTAYRNFYGVTPSEDREVGRPMPEV